MTIQRGVERRTTERAERTIDRRAFLARTAALGTAALLGLAVRPAGASHNEVRLGENRTFYDTNVGSRPYSDSGDGWSIHSNVSRENHVVWTDAVTDVVGDYRAIGRIGKRFTVSGEGSRTARITVAGDASAYLESLLASDLASIRVEFVLRDHATGTRTRKTVFSERVSGSMVDERGGAFVGSVTVELVAGRTYSAFLRAVARAKRAEPYSYPPDWEGEKLRPTAIGVTRFEKVRIRFL